MSVAPVPRVRDALERADCNPRGADHVFISLCPAHADRTPSLSVREGRDGQALIHCFAGCATEAVIAAPTFGRPTDLVVMHPRRFGVLQANDTAVRLTDVLPPGDLVLSPGQVTNLGGGTNEDWSFLLARPARPCSPTRRRWSTRPGRSATCSQPAP